MPLISGTYLGPYEVVSPLGSGGMGEVYLGKDSRLGREVAIKVLPEHLVQNAEALARFERETKALAVLSHPSILTIYDVGNDQELSFAVMELLKGETLRVRIDRSRLSWDKALEVAMAVADGLSAAHSKGVIHRDLKPENIFLTEDNRVKILDFGLARVGPVLSPVDNQSGFPTQPGIMMGTIGYMPPEQIRGEQADARSDIFSFGCVLYEMLTGKTPFHRNTAPEIIAAILKEDMPPLAEIGGVPAELERVVRYCLEKNPERRFQTAQDLAFALKMISSASGTWKSSGWNQQVLQPGKRRTSRRTIHSIAILPFVNAGADPEAEYIVDGLTESIINTLSQLPRLKVMARSSVFRYKGQDVDPLRVGRELNVRAILTGRLLQRADSLNIQAELVDVSDGSQLWGEQYLRKLSDISSIHEEIAQQITSKLRLKLIGKEKKRLVGRPVANTEAYRLYLKGRYYWNRRTYEGFNQAIDYFRQSLQAETNFAPAYAGLADAYALLGGFNYVPPREAYAKAKAEAMKALELDDTLAEAHNSLATVKYRFDWDWSGAEKEFKKAIDCNPGNVTAHHWFGMFLSLMGRFSEGIQHIERALALDPLSVVINWSRGNVLYYAREHDLAIEQYQKTLAMDPFFFRVQIDIGLAYVQKQMFEEAIEEIKKAILAEESPPALSSLGYAYAAGGRKEAAHKILAELSEQSKRRYVSPYAFAVIHVGLGEKEEAFEWLEKAFEEREDALISFRVNPRLDPLRSDPRFSDLLQRVGLTRND